MKVMASGNVSTHIAEEEIVAGLLQSGITRSRAEEQLFRQYDYFIREGIRKYSLSNDESFDAYSDAILSAIEKITNRSFEGRSSIKTWIYQIYHHKCVDLLRKKSTNKNSVHHTEAITDMLYALSDTARSVIQQMMEKTDKELLGRKMSEIGEMCKKLLLFWAEGYPDKEIVLLMEYKTADVVKTSRLRCMDKLRELYKSQK